MTTVTYTLEPVGDIGSHVLDPHGAFGSVVATSEGAFLVDSGFSTGSIFGRLFTADFDPAGPRFQLSSNVPSDSNPFSAVLTNGNIVTVYDNADGTHNNPYFTLRGVDGTAIKASTPFPTNGMVQSESSVAALKDGGFVVSWTRFTNNQQTDTVAQIYNANGTAWGALLQVDADTLVRTLLSSVGALANGGFVVAFEQSSSPGDAMYVRLYDHSGHPVGGNPAGTKILVDAAGVQVKAIGLKDGGFALAYTSNGFNPASSTDITLQIFNADGSSRTGQIRANATDLAHDGGDTASFQGIANITQLDNGSLVVGWSSAVSNTNADVRVRAFDPQGHALTEITTLSHLGFVDENVSFAELSPGQLATVWTRAVQGGSSGDLVGGVVNLVRTSVGGKAGDKINGDSLIDRISGLGGDDKVHGGAGNDRASGGKGDDKLLGGSGDDGLSGGSGEDTLKGGSGADTLDGAKGIDKLYAGKGDTRDVFVFGKGDSDAKDPDRIFGFDTHAKHEAVSDKIDLSDLHVKWGDISIAAEGKNVLVSIDYHGSAKADLVIEVMQVSELHKGDFVL